eukprot:1907662-Amphidinium_carterae.1
MMLIYRWSANSNAFTRELEGAHAQLTTKLLEAHNSVEAAVAGGPQQGEDESISKREEEVALETSRDVSQSLSAGDRAALEADRKRAAELERSQAELKEFLAERASEVRSLETELTHAELQNQELRLIEQEQAAACDAERSEAVALRQQLTRLEESALQTVEVVQSLPGLPFEWQQQEVPVAHDGKAFERLEQLLMDKDAPDLSYSGVDYAEVLRLREQLAKVEESALKTVEVVDRLPHAWTPPQYNNHVKPWSIDGASDIDRSDERLERLLIATAPVGEGGPSTVAQAEQLRREAYELRWHMRDWSLSEPGAPVTTAAEEAHSPIPPSPTRGQQRNHSAFVLQNLIPGMKNIREVASSVIQQLEQNDEALQAAVLLTAPSPPLPPPPLSLFS